MVLENPNDSQNLSLSIQSKQQTRPQLKINATDFYNNENYESTYLNQHTDYLRMSKKVSHLLKIKKFIFTLLPG